MRGTLVRCSILTGAIPDYPSVVAYVHYADPQAGVEWLTKVLQATEAVRMTISDGRIGHAELTLGNSRC